MKSITVRFFIVGILMLCGKVIIAQSLTVNGSDWAVAKSPTTINEAGLDYTNSYESATNQININFTFVLLTYNFDISVKYEDAPLWNDNLKLSLKRSGNGSNCTGCSVSNGTSYLELKKTTQTLFSIHRGIFSGTSYTNIPIQIKLSGVSVGIPVANYGSRIVFTISD